MARARKTANKYKNHILFDVALISDCDCIPITASSAKVIHPFMPQ
jgi:hypothetical protein